MLNVKAFRFTGFLSAELLQFLARRFLIGLLTLLFVTLIIYVLIRNIPGDPTLVQMENMGPTQKLRFDDIKRMRDEFHLDDPWHVGYRSWLRDLFHFDLGVSISRHTKVSKIIGDRVGRTLELSVTSLVLAYLLAVPMGLFSTARSGRIEERSLSTILYMLYSLPAFVGAMFLQYVFAVYWEILPLSNYRSDEFESLTNAGKAWDLVKHAILPVTCYTYGGLAYYSRFVFTNMQEVIRQDYIRTAWAKGVDPFRILVHHAFRNTLIPFVTLVGLSFPALLGGSVILEQIFAWPGIGLLFFESILERDYPTIMALTLMFSVMTLLGNLLADTLYAVVDPRVTYQ